MSYIISAAVHDRDPRRHILLRCTTLSDVVAWVKSLGTETLYCGLLSYYLSSFGKGGWRDICLLSTPDGVAAVLMAEYDGREL